MRAWAAAAILSAAAPAAPPPAAEITVQAREHDMVRSFVQQMANPTPDGQLARWQDGLCSGVIGIAADQAEVLNGHIGSVAAIAGIALQPAGCQPDLLILFTDQPATIAQGIAQRFPITLRREGEFALKRFVRTTRPVRWISKTSVASGGGGDLTTGYAGDPDTAFASASRIQTTVRTTLAFMLVVVDARQVGHHSVGELGDYLGMIALVRPALDARPPRQSVMAMFDDDAIRGLTEIDRRYLASLYRARADRDASAQKSTIRALMTAPPKP
jgi:hypothetical protein